jgi:pimeloyl-ACP methyl ester carboxylesterase
MRPTTQRKWSKILIAAAAVILLLMIGCSSIERRLLFYPSHDDSDNGLTRWTHNGEVIGFARTVPSPRNVWLMFHGNAGQAADRTYALPSFAPEDSVYIMEYPGYGKRRGVPGKDSFNAAAKEAYLLLRQSFPKTPICVAAESIGSGPACFLATMNPPPDKMVLIVPFGVLSAVARDHFPGFVVKMILTHNWDNVAALSNYKGPVQIFAAERDTIIRPKHARSLADSLTNATFTLLQGGHNDWSDNPQVKIRNP